MCPRGEGERVKLAKTNKNDTDNMLNLCKREKFQEAFACSVDKKSKE